MEKLTPHPDADRTGTAIRIARVLCILGLVYIHAWTGLDGAALNAANQTGQRLFHLGLIEALSRSSVPLLSVISGYLVARSLARPGDRGFLAGKVRTILLPMIAWNMIAILLVSGSAWLFGLPAPVPQSLWWLVDEILSIAAPNDINVQTPFLRDLFVCMIVAPFLVRARGFLLGLLVGLITLWLTVDWPLPLLLRPSILVFFVLGILVGRHRLEQRMAEGGTILAVVVYAALVGAKLWLWYRGGIQLGGRIVIADNLDLVARLVGAMVFWKLAWAIARTRAAGMLVRLEPYMFLMFCSHLIMLWLAGPPIGRLVGPMGSPFYPVLLVVQPLLILLATFALARLLRLLPTPVAAVLSGNRLSRPPAADTPGALQRG